MLIDERPQALASQQISVGQEKHPATYLGSKTIPPQCKLWEFNKKALTLALATFEYSEKNIETKKISRKLIVKKDCIYTYAINKKNAERKIEKELSRLKAVANNGV
jgi:hypothetical protein